MIPGLGAALLPASLWPLSPLTPSFYQARGAQSPGLPGSSPLVAQGNVLPCWKSTKSLNRALFLPTHYWLPEGRIQGPLFPLPL